MRLTLVGPPGCGKTSVGREVARRLNWSFVDLDGLLREPGAVVLEEGTHALRRTALQALRQLPPPAPPGEVLALSSVLTGGPELAELLGESQVIYLASDLSHTFPRSGLTGPQSVGLAGTRALWRSMLAERDTAYRSFAHRVIEVGESDIPAVARAVILAMAPRPGSNREP